MSVEPPASELDNAPIDLLQPPKGAMKVIFLIVLADLLGFGVIIPLLPFYARQYAASDFQVGLLFSIYSACQLIATPILGLMSDRFGRRPVLVLSQVGSVIGFLLLGFSTHGDWRQNAGLALVLVYISRVIDGFSGGNISTAQAYVSDVTTKENRAKGMGILGAAFGIGFSIGPALGGLLGAINVSYPAFAAALFSAIAATQTYFRLPESRVHKQSESEVWLHPSRFKPILSNGLLVQLLLIFFFSMMAFVMMESTFAIYLADSFNYSVGKVGGFFAMAGVVIAVVQGGLIGKLTKKFGEWPLMIAGPILVTVAMVLLAEAGLQNMAWLLYLTILLNATGRSLQTPPLSALTSHASPPEQQGTTFGLFHMLGSLARVIGPVIATMVYTHHHASPYFLAGAMTLAIAVWSFWLRGYAAGREQRRGFDVVTDQGAASS